MLGNRCGLAGIRRWLRPSPRRIATKTGSFSFAIKARVRRLRSRRPFRTDAIPPTAQAGARMSDLIEMSRVLYDHQWESTEDWVRKLDQLADLSDEEIGRLVHLSTTRIRAAAR